MRASKRGAAHPGRGCRRGEARRGLASRREGARRGLAWKRENGQRAWTNDRLLHRGLGTPLALGRSVVVGDAFGFVHLLSREDGTLLTRLATDGSAIAAAPVAVANNLVVVTKNGGVFAFAPQ